MRNKETHKKFTWVIKNFSTLQSDYIHSDEFMIGACKLNLLAYPKGKGKANYFSLYVFVADHLKLPSGWRIHIQYRLTIVNQLYKCLSHFREGQNWCDEKRLASLGFPDMIHFDQIHDNDGGFLVNDEVKIVAEVDVLQVVGISEEATRPLKKIKREETSSVNESMCVHGFHVLPSQVESVKRIFRRHPDIALEFQIKNKHLRTACMNVLLNLLKTLCQSLQELSCDDLLEADRALTYVKYSGFEVDWLEKRLEELKEKKKGEEISAIEVKGLEEELKYSKQEYSDIKARLKKEKAKLLTTRAYSLTFDDLV